MPQGRACLEENTLSRRLDHLQLISIQILGHSQACQDHSHLISSTKYNQDRFGKQSTVYFTDEPSPLHDASSGGVSLSSAFSNSFMDKISTLHLKIASASDRTSSPHFACLSSAPSTLLQFRTVSQDEVVKALLSSSQNSVILIQFQHNSSNNACRFYCQL